jgi:N-acetylmuramoyl-L-alanine amidase
MANNEYLRESQDLSILIAEMFGKKLTPRVAAQHKGIGQANFWVLNGAYMPSVLVETCFISNPGEEKLLADRQFQENLAQALCEAVNEFKKRYEAGL